MDHKREKAPMGVALKSWHLLQKTQTIMSSGGKIRKKEERGKKRRKQIKSHESKWGGEIVDDGFFI